mmetsp:Transcript_51902/g.113014  ORF Transcript_51902/g.113014 Transcript_51902/m.113014 type:complete len:443 (-) Transcript_51902:207-1535(-)
MKTMITISAAASLGLASAYSPGLHCSPTVSHAARVVNSPICQHDPSSRGGLETASKFSFDEPTSPSVSSAGELSTMTTAELQALQQENELLRNQLEGSGGAAAIDARTARIGMPLTVAAGGLAALAGGLALFPKAGDEGSAALRAFPDASEAFSESFRAAFVDKKAEEAMMNYFPGSISSNAVDQRVARVLANRGFTPQNTLLATSACPDEVNSRPGEMVELMKNRWGECFTLGGLGGVPFTGKAGFGAYAHHVADGGKLLIVFAPHVGVEANGRVGALRRVDQNGVSTSCGAAVGAFKALKKGAAPESLGSAGDTQINYIKQQLASRLGNLDMAPDQIAYVTYQMYKLIRDFFVDDILPGADYWDDVSEIAVLGGIMINRAKGGDRFMPLMFQTREEEAGSTKDIFEEAFGPLPNLETALGSGDEAASVRKKSLNWDKPRR